VWPTDEIGRSRFTGPAKLAQVVNAFPSSGPLGGLERGGALSREEGRCGPVSRNEQ
jgi:hypothetical protein